MATPTQHTQAAGVTDPRDTTGTASDVGQVDVDKIGDPEAASRVSARGWRDLLSPVNLLALSWVFFQIGLLIWPDTDLMIKRSAHLGFACAVGFALALRGSRYSLLTWPIAVLSLAPAVYLVLSISRIYDRIPELDPVLPWDFLFGGLLLVLVLEASRRSVGLGLVLLAGIFGLYQLFGDLLPGVLGHRIGGITRFMDTLFLSQEGLFGVPTGVAAEVIFYFVLFAAVFDIYGGGRLIIDLAIRLTGGFVGGPAKAAAVASGMTGSISGSAVANVMSTGIFTIPLMKRAGYSARFSAGTEAAASTGGQIMPPVMGAGAFVMADFLQIPYSTVVLGALVPALLYYVGLLIAVDLQARRENIQPLPASEIVSIGDSLRARWHVLVPLVFLIVQIARGFDVVTAVAMSTALTVIVGSLRPSTRMGPLPILEAMIRAGERAVVVALPCALASIIVMAISMTGLGTKFSALILSVAAGNLWLAVGLGGLGCLILGCGMPTTSAYIMAAILVAPALVQLGVPDLVAHMYIFYVAVLANVTPPVALAAYAAAGLARCRASKAGWQAFMLALPGLAVAWAMVLHPDLVTWEDPLGFVWAAVQATTANALLSVAIIGWMGQRLGPVSRALFVMASLFMLVPVPLLSLAGMIMIPILVLYGFRHRFLSRGTATS